MVSNPSRFLTLEALQDLDEIWEFVADNNSRAADCLIDDLFRACEGLNQWPAKGHFRRDVHPSVRFWPVGSYLIVYREKPFSVIAILHGARDIGSILKSRSFRN